MRIPKRTVSFPRPRVGEEKFEDVRNIVGQIGSSPRGRGKVGAALRKERLSRITPALAGKRSSGPAAASGSWDHPRMGGEKAAALAAVYVSAGSPPRGRGKETVRFGILMVQGITPA